MIRNTELLGIIAAKKEFCELAMDEFVQKVNYEWGANPFQSFWIADRLKNVELTLPTGVVVGINTADICWAGYSEMLYMTFSKMTPDDMTQPYHFLNQERIDWLKNKFGELLGPEGKQQIDDFMSAMWP
jgi:hypothetical protein